MMGNDGFKEKAQVPFLKSLYITALIIKVIYILLTILNWYVDHKIDTLKRFNFDKLDD